MKRMLLEGGRVIDPEAGIDGTYDIVVMGGRVASIKPSGGSLETTEGWDVIDCKGLIVIPGLIDLHAHLREPGEEYKETIKTGCEAAAAGGVTTLFCMPNTKPVNDCEAITRFIKKQAEGLGVNVHPVGAISEGLKGETLSNMAELKESGCLAVSDDGRPVIDASLMRRALEYSKAFGLTVISHAEDSALSDGGVMNEGAVSTRLGLKGVPSQAEEVMVARDILLSELTKGKLHVAHVSVKGSVEIIRAAKKRGVRVTAEATPHHLTLTDESVIGYDTDFKMNPPLRLREDIEALREGLKDGAIDCVATDHAPHSSVEKDVEFDRASNGVVGLETSLAIMLSLVHEGVFTITDVIRFMSLNPAKVMGIAGGTLKVGSVADITLVDIESRWIVEPSNFKSKGRNTPFKGKEFKGKVVKTIAAGNVVYEEK